MLGGLCLERETFGTKIANHQLVKQKIANMEADYQMSRLLWLHAGWLKNEGRPSGRATSLAKVASHREKRDCRFYGDRSSRRETDIQMIIRWNVTCATAKRRSSMKARATFTR